MENLHLETELVHAGNPKPRIEGAVVAPIFQSSTFEYPFEKKENDYSDIRYLRLNNSPTHNQLHAKLARLEHAGAALVTASGMAAISTALLTVLRSGDHILVQDGGVYGGTHSFVAHDLARFGIEHDCFDATNPATFGQKLRRNTKAIYTEAATNPLLFVADHKRVVEFARAHKLVSIVDGTLLSPVLFRPLDLGYDIVLHSATKYLNGHSDICAGVIAARDASLLRQVKHVLDHLGGSLDPHSCFLLNRGLHTLAMRVRVQSASALKLAANLERHPAVARVHYALLPSSPSFKRASELFDGGCGGLLSFEVKARDDDEARARTTTLLRRVTLFAVAPSLGGTESLITVPAGASHSGLTPQERQRLGISAALVRVSVGIEHADDLWADLRRALDHAIAPSSRL